MNGPGVTRQLKRPATRVRVSHSIGRVFRLNPCESGQCIGIVAGFSVYQKERNVTLTPAYGRDYKSKKEAQADLDADKDFIIADVFGGNAGRAVNKSQLKELDIAAVNVRYAKLTKVTILKVS
jgi:hypothetical protein